MSDLVAKPGEVVTDGRNVTIGAPVVRAFAVSQEVPSVDAANPTPDAGVDSKGDDEQ